MDARKAPNGRQRRDDVADIDAVQQLTEALGRELLNWRDKGELSYRALRDAQGLMLDHLRSARTEGPLV